MNIIIPVDRKFLCQHRNGDTFATNPATDYVPYAQGEVIEKLKLVGQYTVQTVTEAGVTTLIKAETSGSQIKLTHPYSTWDAEGFVAGNGVYITANGNNTSGTVDDINGTEMLLTAASFFSNLGTTDGDDRDDYVIYSTTPPTTIRFMYGIVPNDISKANTLSYKSLLNNEDQLYTGSGLNGSPTTLNFNGSQAVDMGSVDVTYVGASGTGNSVFAFLIEHIFRIPPFIEDWLTNYVNSSVPFVFQGDNTLRYQLKMNFGVNLNNPNDGKIFEDSFQLSSIGFVGQNFNTGYSDYSFTSNEIDISGDTVTEPDVTQTNSFTASISRASGNFANSEKVYLYVCKLPSSEEYTDSDNTFEENFNFDQLDVLEGAGTSSSSIIRNFQANKNAINPQVMDLEFDLLWSTEQQSRFEDGDYLFVGAVVEDGTLDPDVSDRTLVGIYRGTIDKNPDESGLITQNQIDIFNSAQAPAAATPTSDVDTWDNRAYYLEGSFRLTKEANSNDSLLISLKVATIARIPSTDTFFVIDEYVFPTGSDSKVPGTIIDVDGTGYQAYVVNTTRPLGHLPSSADLRQVSLTTTIPGSYQNYQEFAWTLGIEIPHREWILNQAVDPVFFDSAIPDEFYGLNKKTSNFSGSNSYEIYIVATAEVSNSQNVTTYHMISDQCTVVDFDVDAIGTGWSAVTKYYDTDGNLIDVPYAGEDCQVEVTITHPVSAATNAAGEIVFEYSGETGQTYRLSSDKDWSGQTNALKGLAADETIVELTQPTTTTTVLKCWIKGEFLVDGLPINTYGHLFTNI